MIRREFIDESVNLKRRNYTAFIPLLIKSIQEQQENLSIHKINLIKINTRPNFMKTKKNSLPLSTLSSLIKFYFILLAIFTLVLSESCQKEAIKPIADTSFLVPKTPEEIEMVNQSMDDFAIGLAKSLQNVNVRKMLKNKVAEKFDDDFDVLWKDIKDSKSSEGITFQESMNRNFKKNSQYNAENHPCFQLSIPALFDKWDVESYIPMVAYDPIGKDEADITSLKAYDANGNVHFIDANSIPEMPVVVLGFNERTDEMGNLKNQYIVSENNIENNIQISINSSNKQLSTEDTYLKKIKVMNLSEPWYKGDAEICLIICQDGFHFDDYRLGVDDPDELYADLEFGEDVSFTKKISQSQEDNWVSMNKHVSGATVNDYTSYQIFFWYEDDTSILWYPGVVKYNGHTYYFNLYIEDDELGCNAVYDYYVTTSTYDDPYFYTTSSNDIKYSVYGK